MSTSATAFRRIHLDRVEVTLVLGQFKVQGAIHVEPGTARFSDAWDGFLRMHDRHRFFPVTDATVTAHGVGEPVAFTPFMVVDRDEVVAVYPTR